MQTKTCVRDTRVLKEAIHEYLMSNWIAFRMNWSYFKLLALREIKSADIKRFSF